MALLDSIKEMQTKQKIMLGLVILLMAYAAYLAYSTFMPEKTAPAVAPAPLNNSTISSNTTDLPQTDNTAATTSTSTSTTTPAGQTTVTSTVTQAPAAAPTPEQLALLAHAEEVQQQYLELVSQYQLAQIQQKLAQTNAQIVQSKLTSTEAMVKLQKLEGVLGVSPSGSDNQNVMQVLYVGQKHNTWQAMIKYNGSMYQVRVGTRLPNGNTVTSITSKGVVLRDEDYERVYLPIAKSFD